MEKQNKPAAVPGKRGRYITLVILLLLLAVIAAAAIHFYPMWKTARDFENYIDLSSFSYEMDVELFKDELKREQTELLNALSRLAGIEADSMYRLHISGGVSENKIYAEIYPDGMEEPLIELYLSNGRDVVNGGFLYRSVRSRVVGESQLLDIVLPSGEGGIYLTVEQVERLFDLDLSNIREFHLPLSGYDPSAAEYFAILAALPHVKQTEDSGLVLCEYGAPPEASASGRTAAVAAHFSVRKPSLIIRQNEELLEKLGLTADSEKVKTVKSLSVDISSDNAHDIVIPESEVSQEFIDALSSMRSLLSGLM